NDFVSLLTDRLSKCGYNINIAEDCPSIDSKITENNEGKELLSNICSIKKVLNTEKYSMIANAPVLSNIEALGIRECLEREENIDPACRLALQKYNLPSFYKKTPEDITEDFVEKYSQKEMQNIYSALVQVMNPLDDLRSNHQFMVIGDSREKASCDSLLLKVIALEEILRGIDFSSGIHTSYTLSCQDFDTNLLNFLPIYKKNEHCYYAIFGKKWRSHTNYNLKYFIEFLLKPLKEFKVSFYREKDRNKQPTHLKLLIDRYLKMILPDACLSDNVIADPLKSDLNSSQNVDNTIGEVSTAEKNIPESLIFLSSEYLIKNESNIDILIFYLQEKFNMSQERLEKWKNNILFEMQDNHNY
ncbi:28596_t:CDS:1, partial [Gigaspora margarita]